MSNVINTTIIQNPQQTVNTTVQASQLNGGNLAQNFNLQALRIVKGSAYVASTGPAQTGVANVFINQEDNTPIFLGPNDFIVAYAVANGNMAADTNAAQPVPLVCNGSSTGVFDVQIASVPTFVPSSNSWTAGPITNISILGTTLSDVQLNTNHGSLETSLVAPVGSNQWVSGVTSFPYFTQSGVVNLTLVVLTGFPAQ